MNDDGVTAVIPHWNRRDLLEALLDNLAQQTRRFDEIIVVDNGSTDGSAEIAERAGAEVLRLGRILGSRRRLIGESKQRATDWVAILNNDVTLAPDWLDVLLPRRTEARVWFADRKSLQAGEATIMDGTFDEISRGACACRCGAGKPDSPVWNHPRRSASLR